MEQEIIATSQEYAIGAAILQMPVGGTLTIWDEDGEYLCSVVKLDAEAGYDA